MIASTQPHLTKGHGTGNDFLLVDDPQGHFPMEPVWVRDVTDRHRGIGADGVIRAVRRGALNGDSGPGQTQGDDQSGGDPQDWFMDYHNADGSVAQMCGNGVRVFVHYLRHRGHIDLNDGESVVIGTRGGDRLVTRVGSDYRVTMGRWSAPGGAEALSRGFDAAVATLGLSEPRPGLRIDIPNPHTVVTLATPAELAGLDLNRPPTVDPHSPEGTNVEFVVPIEPGHIALRVFERGVGETLSCGTGACAAAVAMAHWVGQSAPRVWRVDVPGGQVHVELLDDHEVVLSGPAEIVGEITLLADQ